MTAPAADRPLLSDRPPSPSPPLRHPFQSQPDLSNIEQDASMPIAIIGMGFRGPGDAVTVGRLWTMMVEGREAWSPIPASRWNPSAFFHPDHARHGTINVQGGHFLTEDVSLFDAPFFNLTGDEVAAMDPQQRLLLEVTYEGLENAGIPLSKIMGSQAACFVGSFNADYMDLLLRDPDFIPMYQCTNAGQSRAMTANRISYFFDLKGPSVTIDTACSGSLVALHLACQTLRTGDASVAIAAGVNVILSHEFMSTMTMMKFLSPNGRCHTFDERADGYARGEAIGCLILKPLKDAIRDRDHIHAIIRGSGSNQDGRTPGITLPSGAAQEALIRRVYETAGLNPVDTDFVEAHGTGTQAGDPIETEALARVFGPGRTAKRPLRIGSIKTNVGHLEGTSGVAGVIKAVLMLENRMFLPNRNFNTLNPRILLDEWKLKVQLECEPWSTLGPHRVSVNSFGYGGSNAHVVLEDAWGYMSEHGLTKLARPLVSCNVGNHVHSSEARRTRVFLLSAFDEDSITAQIRHLRAYLLSNGSGADDEFMNNLAHTLNERRTAHLYRVGVLGSSAADVAEALVGVARVYKAPRRPNVSFVFTGQGAQWCGMGKGLMAAYPVFCQSIRRIDAYMAGIHAPFRTADILEAEDYAQLSHPAFSQPICSALQIALVDLLASWGIHPDSVTGHSSGEVAAAYTAGALNMEDAMAVAYYRGVVAGNLSAYHSQGKGAMLAIGISADDAQTYIDQLQSGKASVACINSPHSVTISGDESAIQELEERVRDKEVFSRRLAVEVAYHSHHMELVRDEYLKYISHIKPRSEDEIAHCLSNRSVAFYSSVSGTEIQPTELGPQYWVQNLLGQVKFSQSLRTLCFETRGNRNNPNYLGKKRPRRAGTARKINVDFLLEIGPHAALSGPIKQTLKGDSRLDTADIMYISALMRKHQAVATILTMVAILACSGLPVNFRGINEPDPSHEPHLIVDLPSYPWNHSRSYWAEPRLSKVFRNRKYPRTDILGVQDVMSSPFEPRWRNIIRVSETPWLMDHRIQSNIVYPAAGYITMAIEAVSQVASVDAGDYTTTEFYLRGILIRSALVLDETSAVEVITSLRPSENVYAFQGPSYEFHVYSVTDDDRWTEHCTGVVGVRIFSTGSSTAIGAARLCNEPRMAALDVQAFYENLASVGLEYGPCFANITQASYAGGASIAEITIPDTEAVMPMNFQYPHFIHPCTLDGIIHSCFINTDMAGSPAVPVHIEEMEIRAKIEGTAGNRLDVRTWITKETKGEIVASFSVAGKDQRIAASINGLHCRRIDQGSTDSGTQIPKLAYNIEWKADPDMLPKKTLSNLLKGSPMLHDNDLEKEKLYEDYALFYLRKTMNALKDTHFEGISPCIKLYLERLIHDEKRVGTKPISELDSEPAVLPGPEGKALCVMGHNLAAILQGQFGGPTVSNDQFLWDAYWESSLHDPIYDSISKYLDLITHRDPMVSILEIDAGTGLSSWRFLRRLTPSGGSSPRCSRYTVTSPDETVFETAARTLSIWKRWVTFKKLDITEDLESQGFNNLAYDVVIVSYGLHRVGSIQDALENIHLLLKPDGHLILVNSLQSPVDVILFADREETWADNRATYSNGDWDLSLKAAQFSGIKALVESGGRRSMIISRPRHDHVSSPVEILLVTEDTKGISTPLQNMLVTTPLAVEVTSLHNVKPSGKICVVLCDLNTSELAHVDKETFPAIKRIFLEASGVLWVTKGGTLLSDDPDASLITGFARTARSESAVRRIVTLDFDKRTPDEDIAELIYRVIEHRFSKDDPSAIDYEYAAQDGLLLLPRVTEDTALNRSLAISNDQYILKDEPFQGSRPLRTIYDSTSHPSKVRFVEAPTTELAADRVRIRVHATSLKQRDAQAVFGFPTSHMLGFGCSGFVEAVGEDVDDLVPGDRVTGFGKDTVASIYEDRKTAFYKMPADMPFESGAALPETYCSAFYAVHHLARVRASEKVLISLADSAIGQAVLELGHLQRAHVLLFTETAADKVLLSALYNIPEDRILFHDQRCQREGFDVILNCTHSDDRTYHLLWKYINRSGRFIQFSNTQSTKGPGWALPRSQDDVTFATFSLDSVRNKGPDFVDQIWMQVGDLLRDDKLQGPVSPVTYAISEINEALDALVSDQPADLIVLTAGPKDVVQVMHPKHADQLLRSDASYVLVGGLGGIGRATALWMADHGAKTLIFVNRSGVSHAQSQATVCELAEKGVRVLVHAVDICSSTQVENMMSELAHTAPPIRGVIQAAMVLRDIHIEKMTLEDYNAVLGPKHTGTWNLHHHLPKDLDWFIMLSSISGIIGNATQAAYAAGSAFMDSFAAYRNSLGFPTVSLDLGVITDVGYLAENTELASKMAKQGFQGTDTPTLMSLIEAAITSALNNSNGLQPQSSQIITGLGTWSPIHSLPNFNSPLFSHYRRLFIDPSEDTTTTISSLDTIRDTLQSSKSLDEASNIIYSALSARIASHLSIPVDRIDPNSPITEYGIDSHVAVDLRTWILKNIESAVSILEILSSGSLMDLAGRIAEKSELVKVKE
ncbi:putative polyketide synthase [Aspergillus ibericus CBS 121593]|uniref:Polyketide synthase n=1 Tax=Aspergillus ibericus CBS 121593 TaxID=1448316 RepID=A0A395GXY6_9EURO|nr:polyketide synthase [Aspergillus ibericus CBS 121593]RAK99944.1 polyketide synthase [Aspergillus ibericus CBS 121593]